MSWEVGHQKSRAKWRNINEEISKIEGYIEEKDAKILLYKFLYENITFTTELLMGIELFPFQHMTIKAMFQTDYFFACYSRGLSKCTNINTLCMTNRGLLKMGDIQVGDFVQSLNGVNKVLAKTINPEQKSYVVETRSGFVSEGLDYHRTLTLSPELDFVWKFNEDITVDDYIVLKRGSGLESSFRNIFEGFDYEFHEKCFHPVSFIKDVSHINDWYYFFGLVLGDGCVVPESRVSITSCDHEVIQFLKDFTEKIGLNLTIRTKKGSKAVALNICSVELCAFLEFLGFEKLKAHQKVIPATLTNNSNECLRALLQGLFDTDGHCSPQRRKNHGVCIQIGFTSTSFELIKQVRALCLSQFGLMLKTQVVFKGGKSKFPNGKEYECKKAWSLIACSQKEARIFFEKLGFRIKRKQERLSAISEQLLQEEHFCDYVPYIGEYLKKSFKKSSICKSGSTRKMNFREFTSRRLIEELIDSSRLSEEQIQKLNKVKRGDLIFEKVKNISESSCQTVDITVEKEACYVADGIINHNSFTAGIFCGLYALLMQGVHIGILSSSFRQCLEENEFVSTSRGLIRIKDVEVGNLVQSKNGTNKILNKWKNSPSRGKKLTSKRGYSISCKDEHRVLRLNATAQKNEWVDVKDLSEGDIIAIHQGEKMFGTQSKYTPEDAYFYGLLVGDGHVSNKYGKIAFTCGDQQLLDFVENYARLNGFKPRLAKKAGKCACVDFNSVEFIKSFFQETDFVTATQKQVAETILRSPKNVVSAYLQGLFDTDGTVGEDRVELATSSPLLAKQVQLLLLQFGIISKIQVEPARGEMVIMGVKTFGRESYKVRIMNSGAISLFRSEIGFRLERKIQKLRSLNFEGKKTNFDTIYGAGEYLSERYSFPERLPRNLSRTRVLKIIETYRPRLSQDDFDLFHAQVKSNIFWDKVAKIEDVEKIVTYDIEVENEHNYVGGGFINHNSKLIFRKIQDIAKGQGAELFNQTISKISTGNDEWYLECGRSRITALPLGDGEKLRGFRFQAIVIDEFLLMPEKIFSEVLVPFLAVITNPIERQRTADAETKLIKQGKMKEEDRKTWPNNKIITLSSASYQFEFMYKLYRKYEEMILNPNKAQASDEAHRTVYHFSYDVAPTKLYDSSLLEQAKATMSEAQFMREFGSIYTDDSSGYFKVSKMAACTIQDGQGQSVEVGGDPDSEYILAFDPSWSESEGSDDFAMQVLKIDPENRRGTLVHSYAVAGVALKHHMRYFHYLIMHFKIVAMVGDYNGGVQFLNSVNESELFKNDKIEIKTFDADFDNLQEYNDAIKNARKEYNLSGRRICHLRKPSSAWIRYGNEKLQSAFDHKRILFASRASDGDYHKQRGKKIPIEEIKFLSKETMIDGQDDGSKIIDFIEHQKDMIDLTKAECALIQPSSTANGTQTFDLPANLKATRGANKVRKDSYSALVLANWMMEVYFDMMSEPVEEVTHTFTPMFIR